MNGISSRRRLAAMLVTVISLQGPGALAGGSSGTAAAGVRDCAPLMPALQEATAGPGGPVQDVAPAYRIRTTMPGAAPRYHSAVMGVPAPIDAGGLPAPDLIVELAGVPQTPVPVGLPVVGPVTGALRLVVRKIVPGPLPVEVVAQVVLNPTTNERLAVGYDGRGSDAPTHFVATLASLGGSSFKLTTEAHETAGSLRLVGGFTKPNVSSATAFLTMTPMPIAMDVVFAAHPNGTPAGIVVTTPQSIRLDASVGTVSFDTAIPAWVHRRIDATVDRIVAPQSRIAIAPNGNLEYFASGTASTVTLNMQEFRNGALHSQTAAQLRDVPSYLAVERDTPTAARIRTAAPIGSALLGVSEGALAECRTDQGPDNATGLDYLYRKEQAGWSSTVVRFAGVAFADVTMTAGRYHAQLVHPARPLHVLGYDTAQMLVDATITNLPSSIALDYWPAQGRVSYTATGGERIATIDATVSRPTPIFDRVKFIRIFGHDFPPSLDVTVASDSTGAVSLDAGGDAIGFLQVALTSGPQNQIPVPHDAVLVRNLGPDFVVELRVHNLRRFAIARPVTCSAMVPDRWLFAHYRNECTSAIHAELDTKPDPATGVGRPFSVFFTQKDLGGVKDEYVNVDVGPLTPKVTFDFWTVRTLTYNRDAAGDPQFAGIQPALTRAVYRGTDQAGNALVTGGLRVTTNIGQRSLMTADMFPLPAVVDLCLAVRAPYSQNYDGNGVPDPGGNDFADDDCTRRGRVSSDGSMAFGATSYTTINLFDCATPAVGCTYTNKRNYLQIENLTVKNVALQLHKEGANPHHLYLNTGGTSLTGIVTLEDKDEDKGIQANFTNVWAQDRVVQWNGSTPPLFGGSGRMHCTSSDALWVWDRPLLPAIDLLDWTGLCNA